LVQKLKTGNTIISGNSSRDEVVNRFARETLFPHGTIYSLISPFRHKGKVVGSLCLESSDPYRTEWTPEELDFAISATGFITLAMESHERKQAEEEIRKSLKDKEMLLWEIHHRVKNNLQVISSLLYLQAKKSHDRGMIEGLIESQNRVKSMVMIHEKLYKSQDLASFNYSEYIRDLTNSLFRSYSLDSTRIKLELDVGDIILDTDTAVHCGLIINELVSNSMKHAFPNNANGVISIHFNSEGENKYVLVVSDDGIGIKDKEHAETKSTLGMQLIYTLVDQLDGNIDVSNNKGAIFTIHFSLKNKT
jgi:two-component sensor histidine kinase